MSWSFAAETVLTIGRDAPSQLRLPDEKALSREHMRLVIRPPYAELHDNAVRNGTRVNGARVVHATLSNGEQFGAGETEIVFEVTGDRLSTGGIPPQAKPIATPSLPNESNRNHLVQQMSKMPVAKSTSIINPKPATVEMTETVAPLKTQPLTDREALPRVAGSYDLLKKIGEGGMATVYQAKHRGSGQEVAIKLINAAVDVSEKLVQLFAREASILSQLNHPRSVRCLEFGFHNSQTFLVMELIKTTDLAGLIDRQSTDARIKASCWVASRILQALAYAHDKKFVHREIKPGNILA